MARLTSTDLSILRKVDNKTLLNYVFGRLTAEWNHEARTTGNDNQQLLSLIAEIEQYLKPGVLR